MLNVANLILISVAMLFAVLFFGPGSNDRNNIHFAGSFFSNFENILVCELESRAGRVGVAYTRQKWTKQITDPVKIINLDYMQSYKTWFTDADAKELAEQICQTAIVTDTQIVLINGKSRIIMNNQVLK